MRYTQWRLKIDAFEDQQLLAQHMIGPSQAIESRRVSLPPRSARPSAISFMPLAGKIRTETEPGYCMDSS